MKSRFLFIILSLCSLSLFGANIPVTSTADAGLGTLRAAITTANGNGEDDVITITATGTITLASDLPVISTNMTITGPGSASLTIDGGDAHKIFEITGSSTVVIIEDMTITKGEGKLTTIYIVSGASRYGGGIYNHEATVTINDCSIIENDVSNVGGAFFNMDGTMTLNNCNLSGNDIQTSVVSATGRGGVCYNLSFNGAVTTTVFNDCILDNNTSSDIAGAIYANSGTTTAAHSVVELNNCTVSNNSTSARNSGAIGVATGTLKINGGSFYRNTCPSQNGGAIQILSYGVLECTNVTFEENSCTGGGGAIYSESDDGITFQNCNFKNNSATTFGGAIRSSGPLNVDQCTFDGNSVSNPSNSEGGAIFLKGNHTFNVSNSTFINNRSEQYGGAIEQDGGTLNLTNCSISSNSSKQSAGGVENYGSATTNVTNCTVVNNTTDDNTTFAAGLGDYGSTAFTVTNSIVYNNKVNGGSGAEINFVDVNSGGHNITGAPGGLTTGTDDLTNTNPNLGSLANNGGAVQTFAPNTGSPAIDHVDNGSAPCTDARLSARVGNADVGAYESGGTYSDVNISVSPSSVSEDSGTDLVFTFSRSGQTCGDLVVNFSVGGTAVNSFDYTASGHAGFTSSAGSMVIQDGMSSGTVNLTPIDNSLMDGSRTAILTVTSGSSYNVGGGNTDTGTITDDETVATAPEMDITDASGDAIADGANLAATSTTNSTDFGNVCLAGNTTASFTYTITNSGNADLDFTGSPLVAISGTNAGDFSVTTQIGTDPLPHPTGNTTTFVVEFNPTASGVRSTTISIANDDSDENPYDFVVKGTGVNPSITVAATTATIAEDDGSTDLVYRFSRDCTVGTLVVYFEIEGTASDSDYSVDVSGTTTYSAATNTGTITFADGSATADLTVSSTDDSMIEASETVVVKVILPTP